MQHIINFINAKEFERESHFIRIDFEIDQKKRYVLNYIIRDEIDKTTVLYLAKPKSEQIVMQESEIENVKWCEFEEALEMLTFDNWKSLWKDVVKELKV